MEKSRKRRSSDDEIFNNDDACTVSSAPVIKKERSTNATVHKTKQEETDDRTELYGLRPEYLEKLGIKPPLDRWIMVSNFRCDKSDLRDVLELAGHVVICSIITIHEKYAKVMYSHPLEAVQAISMLHNKKFYGQLLKISMSSYQSDTYILPKGLADIGPGLGIGGKPLRDVVKEYEKFIDKKKSYLNRSFFSKTGECPARCDDDNIDKVSLKTIDTWDGEWIVKDEIKDDASEDSVEINLDNFSKNRLFTIRNVEESDDSNGFESGNKKYDRTQSPPLEAPGVSSHLTHKLNKIERCESQCQPKRPNSIGSNSTQGSSKSAPSMNLRSTIPQTTYLRSPELRNHPVLPKLPGVNSRSGYNSMAPRSVPSISGPTGTHMIRPNAPNFMPSSFVTNSVCPVPRPVLGPNVAVPNQMIQNDSRFISGPIHAPVPHPNNAIVHSNIPILGSGPNISGPRPGLTMTVNGPVSANPMLGPGPNLGGTMTHGPMMVSNAPMGSVKTATLEFRNLPPSTTFAILCAKMSECGQVLSIQMTTPGCAIVKYINVSHAERCFQRYNRTCVEGCLIEARFI